MAVTRAEVARLAGVSPAVVSYVINGGPRQVSPATRARVEAAVEAVGYRPNAIAAALRGGKTRSIGLLTPSPLNPYFAELAEAVERELFACGNVLSIGITDDDPTREVRYLRSFLDRQVDGIMLVSSHALASVVAAGISSTPLIVLDRTEQSAGVSSVHIDNVRGSAYAVEHLQSHGHTLLACIAGPWAVQVSADRVDGWRQQQSMAGLEHGPDLVAHAEFSEAGGLDAAHALLGPDGRPTALRGRRPSALFVSSDIQARGAMRACDELGLRIPDDVAMVSFDGTRAAAFTRPPLTTLRQPIAEIAHGAVRHLLARVADGSIPVEHRVTQGHLVVGQSCGCERPRA